jgi:hypothetical protein
MNNEALAKRYRYLWTGEAVSANLFILLLVTSAVRDGAYVNWIARAYSVGVVVWILLQAVLFWRWKLHLLAQEQRTLPAPVVLRFRWFKHLNWILIGAFPLIVSVEWLATGGHLNQADVAWGLLFVVGAVLEQINYYHYQLMYFDSRYDWRYLWKHRRLRIGRIAKMLTPSITDHQKVTY